MPRWRLVAGWLVPIGLAIVLAVLVMPGSDAGDGVPVPAPPAATAATPSPSAVVDASDAPPPLPTDPDDPIGAYRAIVAYENWLRHHPDPALVDEIHDPDCPCSEVFKEFLAYLVESGETIDRGDVTIDAIEIESQSGQVVRLRVWVSSLGYGFVSPDGTIEETREGMIRSEREVTVLLDGSWRLLNHRWSDSP